jgi:hypothetical protein
MKYKFNKNITCENSHQCQIDLLSKIEKLTGKLFNDIDETVKGHISISHKKNNHTIWLFLYNENKKHESESNNKTVINDFTKVKKYDGKKITITELEKL